MKTRSIGVCLGVLLLMAGLTATDAAADGLTQIGTWMSLSSPGGGPARDIVINGHYAYVTTDTGLKIIDLSPLPNAPVVVGSLALGGRGLGIKFLEPHVYIASQTKDLQIVDVSDPTHPKLVKTKSLPGGAWDVALKDERPGGRLIAYTASFGGEMYVVDVTDVSITNPAANPVQLGVLGMIAWGSAGGDASGLTKHNNHVPSGNGKVTGLDVRGNTLAIVEFAHGRVYYYDISNASAPWPAGRPVFSGTHYAPFTFRAKIDQAEQTVYALSASSALSGIYSVRLGDLDPSFSTRHASCSECGYFQSPATDNGGLTISSNGRYVIYIAGKLGEIQVVDIADPTNMQDAGSFAIPHHYAGTGLTMGVAQYGNEYIVATAAKAGLGVFRFQPPFPRPGLSN